MDYAYDTFLTTIELVLSSDAKKLFQRLKLNLNISLGAFIQKGAYLYRWVSCVSDLYFACLLKLVCLFVNCKQEGEISGKTVLRGLLPEWCGIFR